MTIRSDAAGNEKSYLLDMLAGDGCALGVVRQWAPDAEVCESDRAGYA